MGTVRKARRARSTSRQRYTLPQKVTDASADKISKLHLRVLLDYLGVPVNRQPTSKGETADLFTEYVNRDVERAQTGYDVIVLGKTSSKDDAAIQGDDKYKAIENRLHSMVESLSQEAQKDAVSIIMDDVRKSAEVEAKKAVREAATNYRPIEIRQGKTKRKIKGETLPDEFDTILKLANQRINIMLVGPSGCGKTYCASKVAEALGLSRYASQSCSEGVSESNFTGWLLPIGERGKFKYVPTDFIECYEKGGVFLFDEMDNADSNMLAFLNQAIANDHFFLPQRYEKPMVKKHKDFVCIAACNTFGSGADAMYVARNQLDAATLDRFRTGMIVMDYSEKVERSLASSDVFEWGVAIRKSIRKHNLRRIMSTRTMIDMTTMHENEGWSKDQWERAYFADWTPEEIRMAKSSV